jgi:hypothetical protein
MMACASTSIRRVRPGGPESNFVEAKRTSELWDRVHGGEVFDDCPLLSTTSLASIDPGYWSAQGYELRREKIAAVAGTGGHSVSCTWSNRESTEINVSVGVGPWLTTNGERLLTKARSRGDKRDGRVAYGRTGLFSYEHDDTAINL